MDSTQLIGYLNNPSSLNEKSVVEIRELINKYPYFQTAYILHLKNLKNLNDKLFDYHLRISSAYISSRAILYKLINSQLEFNTKGSEPSVKESSVETKESKPSEINGISSAKPVETKKSNDEITSVNKDSSKLIVKKTRKDSPLAEPEKTIVKLSEEIKEISVKPEDKVKEEKIISQDEVKLQLIHDKKSDISEKVVIKLETDKIDEKLNSKPDDYKELTSELEKETRKEKKLEEAVLVKESKEEVPKKIEIPVEIKDKKIDSEVNTIIDENKEKSYAEKLKEKIEKLKSSKTETVDYKTVEINELNQRSGNTEIKEQILVKESISESNTSKIIKPEIENDQSIKKDDTTVSLSAKSDKLESKITKEETITLKEEPLWRKKLLDKIGRRTEKTSQTIFEENKEIEKTQKVELKPADNKNVVSDNLKIEEKKESIINDLYSRIAKIKEKKQQETLDSVSLENEDDNNKKSIDTIEKIIDTISESDLISKEKDNQEIIESPKFEVEIQDEKKGNTELQINSTPANKTGVNEDIAGKDDLIAKKIEDFKRKKEELKKSKQKQIESISTIENQVVSSSATEKRSKSPNEIIDKFIKEEPKIAKKSKKIVAEDVAEEPLDISTESIEEKDVFITENLAKIYYDQKHFQKALGIYEKLILKYPEKKDYFAIQIEMVKKNINKQ